MQLPHWAATAPTRHGRMAYPAKDLYVGRSLAYYGEWCQAELDLLLKLAGQGSRVIEVGANLGADTVPLALGGAEVWAMEPQPEIYGLLRYNLEATRGRSVFYGTYPVAIGNKIGDAILPTLDYNVENNYGGIAVLASAIAFPGTYHVPLTTLDALFASRPDPWDRLDLIKADVEGMELDVLQGAIQLIGRFKPALYLENNPGPKSADLIRLLRRMGYLLWWHVPPLFNPDNWRQQTTNLWPGVVSCNMLALPPGHPRSDLTHDLKPVGTPTESALSAIGYRTQII